MLVNEKPMIQILYISELVIKDVDVTLHIVMSKSPLWLQYFIFHRVKLDYYSIEWTLDDRNYIVSE